MQHNNLGSLLQELVGLWYFDSSEWHVEEDKQYQVLHLMTSGSTRVLSVPKHDQQAVRRLRAMADTVNLINNHLHLLRDPYSVDVNLRSMITNLRAEISELENEVAELRQRLEELGYDLDAL